MMKQTFILHILIFLSTALQAQEYCTYNSQRGYTFGTTWDYAKEILEQSNEKFVIVGERNSGPTVGVLRVFANGNLDPSFGTQGKVTGLLSGSHGVTCAALQPDESILIGGGLYNTTSLINEPYLMRLDPNGNLDATFGNSGVAVVPIGVSNQTAQVSTVRILANGTIMVISKMSSTISSSNSGYGVSRLLPDGSPDLTYNGTGFNFINLPMHVAYDNSSSTILEDGTCFIVDLNITGGYSIEVTKIAPDGTVDSDFGIDGTSEFPEINMTFPYDQLRSTEAFDGGLLISGLRDDDFPFVLKLDSDDGSLVESFGEEGILIAPIQALGTEFYDFVRDDENQKWILIGGPFGNEVAAMAIDDDGNILNDCGNLFNQPPIGQLGSQNFTAGLIDSEGIIRITGNTGVLDEDDLGGSQGGNIMWAFYTPPAPEPLVLSVSPDEVLINDAVELTVKGFGFENVNNVWLSTSTGNIDHSILQILDDETMKVTFDIPDMSLEIINLTAFHTDFGPLTLLGAIELIDERITDIQVTNNGRSRVLAGAVGTFHTQIENRGTTNLVGAPLVYINRSIAELDFNDQPKHDYTEDPNMTELINYISLFLDPEIVNQVSYDYIEDNPDDFYKSHALISSYLPPSGFAEITALNTISQLGLTTITTVQNPNGILPSKAIVPGTELTPPPCMKELVLASLLETVGSVDLDSYDDCFDDVFISNQEDLAGTIQSFEGYQVIPMTGFLYKLLFEMMGCVDQDYVLLASEFEGFTKDMIKRLTNYRIIDEDSFCDGVLSLQQGDQGNLAGGDPIGPNNPAPINPDPGLNPPNPGNPNPNPGTGGPGGFVCTECFNRAPLDVVSSIDPNEKNGPTNAIDGQYVNYSGFNYDIHFENLDSADIAAKTVLIVDTLDMLALDLSTFKFQSASWGTNVITLEQNAGITEVDLRPEVPNILRITTELNTMEGLATWKFETIDTLSLYPTEDVDQGFLPPNVNAPEGMGFVSFSIDLLEGVEAGTAINNKADIYFDFNESITTNTWFNIFDDQSPESSVNEITDYVPGESEVNITWDSEDDDVRFYNIYVNEDGSSDWEPWQVGIQSLESTFDGEVGMTYYFKSVAIDSALNVEEYSEMYDAMIYMNPVGVDELDSDGFMIYPNPAKEQVIVKSENSDLSYFKISDVTGKEIASYTMPYKGEQTVVNVEGLSAGMYIFEWFDSSDLKLGQSKLIKE